MTGDTQNAIGRCRLSLPRLRKISVALRLILATIHRLHRQHCWHNHGTDGRRSSIVALVVTSRLWDGRNTAIETGMGRNTKGTLAGWGAGVNTRQQLYRVAQKSKPPPIFQKIALKIANEIRFLRKVKVWIKHYNTIKIKSNQIKLFYSAPKSWPESWPT